MTGSSLEGTRVRQHIHKTQLERVMKAERSRGTRTRLPDDTAIAERQQLRADMRQLLQIEDRQVLEGLDRREVAEFIQSGPGIPAVLRFRPDWAWCAEPYFIQLLMGEA